MIMLLHLLETYAYCVVAQEKISKRLRETRLAKGMTQEQLSGESGVEVAYISFIETGHRKPTIPTLEKLAKGLGMSLEDLFKGL